MNYLCLAALLLVLTGCAQASVASTSLDQFNTLAPSLHSVTRLTADVAADVRAINRGMQHNNRRWITRSAVKLKRDSARLGRMSGKLRVKVNRVMEAQSAGAQRQYVGMIRGALQHQGWEARWTWRLAATVHRDPLLASPANYHAARFDAGKAARAAAASVLLVREARSLEAHHRDQFGLAGSPAGGAQGGQAT